jgi:hypothetical protein
VTGFEVSSIKRNVAGGFITIDVQPNGRPGAPVSPTQLRLRRLLADRFRLRSHVETREMPIYALIRARTDGTLGRQLERVSIDCSVLTSRPAGPPSLPKPGERPPCRMSVTPVSVGAGGVPILQLASILAMQVGRQVAAATRADSGDVAVAALVAEVRALRADLAAASRNQLRAQMLPGRVQMQEQRLAYLDKQRADTAAAAMAQSQMMSMFQSSMPPGDTSPCDAVPGGQDAKRECEANFTARRRQLADQETRVQQLRQQENDLVNALQTEQARWSEFNARLDELEQSLR